MQSESINMSISSTFIYEGVRIFLFTSLSHCKVHYRFDREGAVSWLHQLPPEGLVACAGPSDARICSTAAKDYLVSALPTVEEQQAGRTKTSRHIDLPLKNVCLGEGWGGIQDVSYILPLSSWQQGDTHVFPLSPGLFVHLLPDSMQPLHREL